MMNIPAMYFYFTILIFKKTCEVFLSKYFYYQPRIESNSEYNEYLNGLNYIYFHKIIDQKPFPTVPVVRTGLKSLFLRYFIKLNVMIAI
jgi:hypothetical protein